MKKNRVKSSTYIAQQFNIGSIGQMNNGVTTVINNYGKDGEPVTPKQKDEKPEKKNTMEQRETTPIREKIMLYVSCLTGELVPEWEKRYMDLWDGILNLPVVEAMVYNPGKQQNTSFNRNLVANIIHFLGTRTNNKERVYKAYNAALFTEKLEHDKDHPVRAALGKDPSEDITKRLESYLETFLLK